MRRRFAAVCLAGALACGDGESVETVAFAEVCGEAGPVRLLELAPGRQLSSFSTPLVAGDRRYFTTSLGAVTPDGIPVDLEPEVWSTGLCGESPRQLATDRTYVFLARKDRWPGVVLGCEEGSFNLILIDPAGGPPTSPMPGVRCGDVWIERGVVVTAATEDPEAAFSALMLHPYPEDLRGEAPPPVVLHPEVRLRGAVPEIGVSRYDVLRILPDEVLALDAADRLIRIDLTDGTTTVEATDVLSFQLSPDGRYLLWQHKITDALVPESPVILQDRDTGMRVALGELFLPQSYAAFTHLEHQLVTLSMDRGRFLRVFRLPNLEIVDVPYVYGIHTVLDDGRWLLDTWEDVVVFDPVTEEQTVLLRESGDLLAVNSERALFQDLKINSNSLEGPIYAVPLDGSAPHVVARRASFVRFLPGRQHMASPVGLDGRLRGELVLVDFETASEQRIDDRVPVGSVAVDAGFGPGHVVYSVDDGARSGVYVARLSEP